MATLASSGRVAPPYSKPTVQARGSCVPVSPLDQCDMHLGQNLARCPCVCVFVTPKLFNQCSNCEVRHSLLVLQVRACVSAKMPKTPPRQCLHQLTLS